MAQVQATNYDKNDKNASMALLHILEWAVVDLVFNI